MGLCCASFLGCPHPAFCLGRCLFLGPVPFHYDRPRSFLDHSVQRDPCLLRQVLFRPESMSCTLSPPKHLSGRLVVVSLPWTDDITSFHVCLFTSCIGLCVLTCPPIWYDLAMVLGRTRVSQGLYRGYCGSDSALATSSSQFGDVCPSRLHP